MTIPSYQTLMLPLLRRAAQGEVAFQDAVETLAKEFQLTPEEAAQRLPSGPRVLYNRASWAKTELFKACLIEQPKRGYFTITQRGKDLLSASPPALSRAFLYERYPEFREFVQAYQQKQGGSEEAVVPTTELSAVTSSAAPSTPDEQIDAAARTLNTALEADLLARIRSVDPSKFEQLVVDLLIAMGFGGGDPEMGERLGGTGDGGIDGVIQEDALGLDAVYIQAKRYQDGNTVSAPALQAFVGSLVGQRANKGVFVTSSTFTPAAKNYVRNVQHRIVLIDGEEFARLLVRHGVGVREDRTVTIKKMDEDYFAF